MQRPLTPLPYGGGRARVFFPHRRAAQSTPLILLPLRGENGLAIAADE